MTISEVKSRKVIKPFAFLTTCRLVLNKDSTRVYANQQ